MAGVGADKRQSIVEARFPRGIMTPRNELLGFAAKLLRVATDSEEYAAGKPNVHLVAERMAGHVTAQLPGASPDIRLFDDMNWLVQLDLPTHLQGEL